MCLCKLLYMRGGLTNKASPDPFNQCFIIIYKIRHRTRPPGWRLTSVSSIETRPVSRCTPRGTRAAWRRLWLWHIAPRSECSHTYSSWFSRRMFCRLEKCGLALNLNLKSSHSNLNKITVLPPKPHRVNHNLSTWFDQGTVRVPRCWTTTFQLARKYSRVKSSFNERCRLQLS